MYTIKDGGDQLQSLEQYSAPALSAAFSGVLVSDNRLDNYSPPRRGSGSPGRDSRGRWVRQSAPAETIAAKDAKDFVFDDRIFEGALPPLTEEHLLRPESAENPVVRTFDAGPEEPVESPAASDGADHPVAPEAVVAPFTPVAPVAPEAPVAWLARIKARIPWTVPIPSWRFRLRPALLLVGALLVLGIVFLVVQRGSFGSRRAEVAAPPPPPTVVAPVVVPSVPKPAARRPASRAVAAPPVKKDAATAAASAPIVIPPAPQPAPAVPKPAAQAEPVAAAPPSPSTQPVPPPPAEKEPVAAGVLPSRTTPDEEGWFNLADEYLQAGDDKRAESLYRRILDEGTQKGRAALALGDLFARKNDFNRAQEFYRVSKRLFQDREQPPSPP